MAPQYGKRFKSMVALVFEPQFSWYILFSVDLYISFFSDLLDDICI